jgi:hypothetical protein
MKKNFRCSRSSLVRTAYHEAAHAVVGYLVGATVCSIVVYNPPLENGLRGRCEYGFGPADNELELIATLAGHVSEAIRSKRNLTWASLRFTDDYYTFRELFRRIHNLTDGEDVHISWDKPIAKYIAYMSARIKVQYLEPNWHLVERVAEELLNKAQVTASDFLTLVDEDLCGMLAPGRPGSPAPLNLNPSLFTVNRWMSDQRPE